MHKFIDITGRNEGPIIGIGAMVGAFAFFFTQYLPLLANIRKQYPNATIIGAGETANWWYTKGLCDYYIGVDIDPSITLSIGWNPDVCDKNDNPDLTDMGLRRIVIEQLGQCDMFINLQYPTIACAQIYKNTCAPISPLSHALDIPYNPNSNKIAIWGRKKPDTRSGTNGYNEQFHNTIDYLIDKGFMPVVCGGKGFSAEPKRNDVINLLEVDNMERAERHTRELSECLFSINTATSSTEYTMLVPTPALLFDINPRDECLYRVHRNFFHVKLKVYNPVEWPNPLDWKWPAPGAKMSYDEYSTEWEDAIDMFVTDCRQIMGKPYERELSRPEGLSSHDKLNWQDLIHLIPNRETAHWPKV